MRVVPSGLVQDMRGSIGGSTFGAWKGVLYMRNKAVTVSNPQTAKQQAVRVALAGSVSAWRLLTAVQKAQWEEYAQQLRGNGASDEVVGDMGIIPQPGRTKSGFNAYIGVNQHLRSIGLSRVSVPPAIPQPELVGTSVVAYTGSKIHIEFSSSAKKAGTTIYFEMWLKGHWKASHSYIVVFPEIPEPPAIPPAIDVTTIRKGSGDDIQEVPFSALVPCDIFWQYRVVRSDGYISPPSQLFQGVVIA